MKHYLSLVLLLFALTVFSTEAQAQRKKKKDAPKVEQAEQEKAEKVNYGAFKLRNVGPAFTSGRIADIAIHPEDDNVWYVAVGSGGVWKTANAGVTWKPLFDKQSVYSIGCITIDPNNPNIIWVGTGENVGGRHVGFGDGVYKSMDGGKSWKNMGLKKSEHLSKIIVHPENSNVVWVASQGPLWNKGGERGLYKSVDGGENWTKSLGNEEWTGVTDIALDPRDPERIYAVTWDRHRTVAAYMGGGPGTGIHRSDDGGETWTKLKKGIPSSNLGKIGIALNPHDPDVIYAAIELDRRKGGVYKSTDRGASWSKQSDAISGGTGPHYYQELYTSPHHPERLYLMNVSILMSDDGGKNFKPFTRITHSDNHAIAFRADDPDYVLVGTDGGLYESFDGGSNWRFIDNMPITQYYKVAVDDREPFYHIFGGTQDNGSHGGPSRTDNWHGIRNADWYKTLGGDGHQSATEPGNPDIIYAESQQGYLSRVDQITGESVFIQPQAGEGEDYERYNWDAPILVSPHSPKRLYFASQRVWRSDNRGDSWTDISGDLTRNEERVKLPIMGKVQSYDNPWDVYAMSNYNSITSLSESPVQEGLIYAGTDDGIIQVTENGGETWTKIMAKQLPNLPERAFINDIKADLHDANTVYVALDNHKEGDYKSYLYKSTDKGKTWTSIAGDLPEKHLVWRIVQDHVKPELMFLATEFGIYFTLDAGKAWNKLSGAPTISFRDLVIQKRENDLVGASFGRSFFVLDDYSPLREVNDEVLAKEGALFPVKDALWYQPKSIVSAQGNAKYVAENPAFGAVFTYYLSEKYASAKSERKKKEKELAKEGKDIPFAGWDALAAESADEGTKIWLTVKDSEGNVVRRIAGKTGKGFHRVSWDLMRASQRPIKPGQKQTRSWWERGFMSMPGDYTVTLSKQEKGKVTDLSEPVEFKVTPLRDGALEGASKGEFIAFIEDLEKTQGQLSAANYLLEESMNKVDAMQTALTRTNTDMGGLYEELYAAKGKLMDIKTMMEGNAAKNEIGEKNAPDVSSRFFTAYRGATSTYGPTPMHKESLALAQKQLKMLMNKLQTISEEHLPKMEKRLSDAGAPWIEGQAIPRD
ncbi:MAG: glycosyl hydrolase [Bacteroidota bacterium]